MPSPCINMDLEMEKIWKGKGGCLVETPSTREESTSISLTDGFTDKILSTTY